MADLIDLLAGGGMLAFLGAYLLFALLIIAALWIYTSLALIAIAKKTKTKNAWLAWIPIVNVYLITQMAKVSGLWTLILLASFIPFIGSLAIAAVTVWMFWRIAESIDFPGWTSLITLIPIANLIMLGIWAWAKK